MAQTRPCPPLPSGVLHAAALDPFVVLLHSIVVHLSVVLPGPAGLQITMSLVLVTLALRAALLPLSLRAFRGQQARLELAPEIARLHKQHGTDRARLTQEVMAAHRRADTSPLAGMGSLLLQAPVMATLYRLVTSATVAGHANALTTVNLLGTPLSAHWLPVLASSGWVSGPALLGLVLGLGLLGIAWLQARRQPRGALQLLPFGSVAWAAVAPVAFSVYLLTTTTWSLLERSVLPRLA